VGVAAAAGAVGAPVVPGFVLWVGGGGVGLLLLGAVLLLNLGEDERGPRRLRLRPTLTAPLLALLWSALAGPLVGALPGEAAVPLTSAAVAAVLVDDLALPATAGLVALAASLVVAVALVRRRT
jgi:NADH:ubiquinone oxidoreductase subunit 6 (subunit J)